MEGMFLRGQNDNYSLVTRLRTQKVNIRQKKHGLEWMSFGDAAYSVYVGCTT